MTRVREDWVLVYIQPPVSLEEQRLGARRLGVLVCVQGTKGFALH